MKPPVGPYAFHPHPVTWGVLVASVALIVAGHGRLMRSSPQPIRWPTRQIAAFAGGWALAALALTWPLADLAAHWSLTALVFQRSLLVLAVAPLVLCGIPYDVLEWLTRPAPVDAVLTWISRPVPAVAAVTALLVGSMAVPLVVAQSRSPVLRGLLDVAVLVAGLILWIPVIGRIPGIFRLRPVLRFGYLAAQAVIPAFLSFIYILSSRPLYRTFSRSHMAIGLRPLNDQQVAGFVSKLSLLIVLLTVGAVVLTRTTAAREEADSDEPLVWGDVEREFRRAERRAARHTAGAGIRSHRGAPRTGSSRPNGLGLKTEEQTEERGDGNVVKGGSDGVIGSDNGPIDRSREPPEPPDRRRTPRRPGEPPDTDPPIAG